MRDRWQPRGQQDPSSSAQLQQLTTGIGDDPDVTHVTLNQPVVIPGTAEQLHLNQSTVAILDTLNDTTTYFGTTVYAPYIGQPALGVIHLPTAQPLATGEGVIVAIIDTGVDPNHPALQGSLVAGYDFTRDEAGSASELADLDQSTVAILDQVPPVPIDPGTLPAAFGHGTMVGGLVHLVAPAAKIMPLKAFTADGVATLFDIEQAIYYAVDHGAKVINMSFSMTSPDGVSAAVDYATQHGVILLASVGNSALNTTVYPAGFHNVLGVASTTIDDQRSAFSNYGDHLVKVAAPGEQLITLYPANRYAQVSGTSFSAGLVSGAAGLLAQLQPTIDQRLTARYFDDGAFKRPDWQLGDGRVNLYDMLQAHVPPPPDPPDDKRPSIVLTSPTGGAIVTGVFPLAVVTSDNVGVVGVQYTLDGANLQSETTFPFTLNWSSTTATNGSHMLSAIARDAAGNAQVAGYVTVTVDNDTTLPTVSLTNPANGATVGGTIVLGALAADNVAVGGVQFTLDGQNVGAEDTVAPSTHSWNSGSVANGIHVLAAVARDTSGNYATAASVTVTVFNDTTAPAVSVTNPQDGGTVAGSLALGAVASDDVAVAGVQFTLDGVNLGAEQTGAPYSLTWNSVSTTNGVHVIGAVARDAAGNTRTATVSVTVNNDTTPPAVSLTNPEDGSTVLGSISLLATASDGVGVVGVQFTLDGVNFGSELSDVPYTLTWDTATVANGTHVLAARARDAAGNVQTSASVTVTVNNQP